MSPHMCDFYKLIIILVCNRDSLYIIKFYKYLGTPICVISIN